VSASFELTSLPGWAIVRSLLNDLRAQSALFEAFMARELGALGALRLALDERQGEVERQQAAVNAQRLQVDDRWKQLDAVRETIERGAQRVQDDARRLAAAQTEFAAVASALGQQGGVADIDAVNNPPPRQGSHEELAALREQLRHAQVLVSSLAGTAPELRAARREVDKLRRRLMRQNARLAQAKAQGEAQQSQQIQQLKIERNRLACELEASQRRTAELVAQSDLQREQMAAERKTWLGELRRLRQAVDTQLRGGGNALAGSTAAYDGGRPEESLDSILSQLETLQKELSQRLQPIAESSTNRPGLTFEPVVQPQQEFTP
jgi:chromosome segregation ATPase